MSAMRKTYLFPKDFDRCVFSFRSFSSRSSNSGMAAFSISQMRATFSSLSGRLVSSKLRTGFVFMFDFSKSYFNFFCASTACFILRTASWCENGFECLKSSRINSLESLFCSKGSDGNSLTECFIPRKDAKQLQVLPIRPRSSTHQFDLDRQLAPAISDLTFCR